MKTETESESSQDLFVGIDVGGTSIKLGIISSDGAIKSQWSIPTEQEKGPDDAVERLRASLMPKLDTHQGRFQSIGLGTPGPLDSKQGMILDPANLPGWLNYPIRDRLSEVLRHPVTYTNDGNAAAFGEFWLGTGRQYDSLVLLTLGTGVGAGIICDGLLISGAIDHAAECGHISVDYCDSARMCSCGKTGHLEAYASATAVSNRARQLGVEFPSSLLGQQLKNNGSLSATDVYDCAKHDDELALNLISETAAYLARGISNVVQTIDPQIVLLGGAMNFGGNESAIGRRFLAEIDQKVRRSVFQRVANSLKIEFASLGSAAGWIGAAGLAKRDYDRTI